MKKIVIAALLLSASFFAKAQNVGIGTTNPSSKLHVVGETRADNILVIGSPTSNELLSVKSFYSAVDQQQTIANTFYSGGAVPAWQSFTAGNSGTLTNVEFRWTELINSTNLDIKIYEGEGTSGNLLFSQNIYTPTIYPYTNVAVTGVTLTAGQKYTLWLSNRSSWPGALANPYTQGISSVDVQFDYAFKTYILGPTSTFTVKNNGNVAIGNVNSEYKLDVDGTTNTDYLNVQTLATTSSLVVSGSTNLSTLDVAGATHLNTLTVGNGNTINKIHSGTLVVGGNAGNGRTKTVTLTFPTPFTAPPKVFANASTETGQTFNDGFSVTTRLITNTNCVLIITRTDDAVPWLQNLKVDWMAVQ